MRECPECRNAVEDAARFCPHCGSACAAAAEVEDPWLGRTVNGKFRVEALVGQGGMGRVYRARHLTLDRAVVLKMLHREFSSDPQVVQRFQREARAASRLNHPNSIAVLDFGEAEDGTLFMAMEYLAGRDLARVIAEEFPLGEPRIARIGAQILSALAEAHAQGIVHRDLKPENVMVEPRRDEPDFVKVLDFGIAKITAPGVNEPKLTQAGLVCGTPEYMSPEQARGAELDARTDLYSTGVMLYQMATGELPFQSDTPVGFLTKHLAEVPVPARERWGELSPEIEAVISRAMEKDPAARYQTADEMRAALLAAVPVRPAVAPTGAAVVLPTPAAPPAAAATGAGAGAQVRAAGSTTAARPSRLLFWAFAGVIVLAAAGGGAVTLLARQGVAERKGHPDTIPPTQTPAATAIPTPTATATPTTTTTTPTTTTTTTAAAKKTPAAAPRRDPARALDLYRKGEAKRAAQEIDAAIKLYLAAERSDPRLADVQKKLALCYQLRGDTRRAADRYRRYLATRPPDAERVRAILSTLE